MKNILKITAGLILILAILPFIQFMTEYMAPTKFSLPQVLLIAATVVVAIGLFFSGVFVLSKVKR